MSTEAIGEQQQGRTDETAGANREEWRGGERKIRRVRESTMGEEMLKKGKEGKWLALSLDRRLVLKGFRYFTVVETSTTIYH